MQVKIYTVGNMVDIPENDVISRHDSENTIVFVGKMNYEPNVVAVTYFAENVFPELQKKYPNLIFQIVGAHPDNRVLRLCNNHNIQVTGFVDSIVPYFQHATIVVAPMQTGAGIQNKIIQAMSYGCCVVTTPIGAEGLVIDNDEIAIYDTINEFICGISSLLNNPDKRREMGKKARKYVKENLSKEIIANQFWNFIEGK